jgi:hypothetical protein
MFRVIWTYHQNSKPLDRIFILKTIMTETKLPSAERMTIATFRAIS